MIKYNYFSAKHDEATTFLTLVNSYRFITPFLDLIGTKVYLIKLLRYFDVFLKIDFLLLAAFYSFICVDIEL